MAKKRKYRIVQHGHSSYVVEYKIMPWLFGGVWFPASGHFICLKYARTFIEMSSFKKIAVEEVEA